MLRKLKKYIELRHISSGRLFLRGTILFVLYLIYPIYFRFYIHRKLHVIKNTLFLSVSSQRYSKEAYSNVPHSRQAICGYILRCCATDTRRTCSYVYPRSLIVRTP